MKSTADMTAMGAAPIGLVAVAMSRPTGMVSTASPMIGTRHRSGRKASGSVAASDVIDGCRDAAPRTASETGHRTVTTLEGTNVPDACSSS